MRIAWLLLLCGIAACAAKQPQTPYPAFIQVEALPDVFIAGLPGVRAKQLAGNPDTRRSSNRIQLPADWDFTTGAAPGKSVEIFVLAGDISISDLTLDAGSYVYVPPASTGLRMRSTYGALLLYFLDDANDSAVIRTPLILDSKLVRWQPVSDDPSDFGRSAKVLREDPGSGARTWLEKIDPVATQEWQQSSVSREGFLVSGSYRDGECINGQSAAGDYTEGGYFHRVPGAVSGGPEAGTVAGAVWYLRVPEKESVRRLPECVAVQRAQ